MFHLGTDRPKHEGDKMIGFVINYVISIALTTFCTTSSTQMEFLGDRGEHTLLSTETEQYATNSLSSAMHLTG